MQTRFSGRVWLFGDNIDTDRIVPGKYLGLLDAKEWAKHCLEAENPRFPQEVKPGDIIVAGRNFGCGSSREHAPVAIKTCGVPVVVAESFARIFFRNAINIGLPILECKGIAKSVSHGERIEVDVEKGEIRIQSGRIFRVKPLPKNVLDILEAGGLVRKLKKELGRD